jgi:hypothetical protein
MGNTTIVQHKTDIMSTSSSKLEKLIMGSESIIARIMIIVKAIR